ncbi:MAG TPA: hypothetical protein VFP68_23810 [Burkholderiaceae bacterium]|nr:hypothetical protein [Burkholderiaceae bacterium]
MTTSGPVARWSHGALLGYFMLEGPVLTDAQIDLILSTVDRDKRRPLSAG